MAAAGPGSDSSASTSSASSQARAEERDHVVVNGHDGEQVLIRVFPGQARLAEDVRRVALAARGSSADDDELRANVERGLRAWYPHLSVRTRVGLAAVDEHERVWYVMRDGHVPPDAGKDRLFAALANARDRRADAEATVARSRELVETAHRPQSRGSADG